MSVEKRKDGRYRVHFRDSKGIHRSKSFGRGRKAELLAKAFDLEVKREKALGHVVEHKSDRGINFEQLALIYIKSKHVNGGAKRFLNELHNLIFKVALAHIPTKPVDKLTYADLIPFRERYKDHSIATRNRYTRYLRTIFRYGLKYGLIHNNPLEHWSPAKEGKKHIPLTAEDLKKIYKHSAPHLKWIIQVQWNLGLRPGLSELFSLKWHHIDFENREVHVYAAKTKEPRSIPISKKFRNKLLERKSKASTEFVIEYDRQQVKSIRKALNAACKRAKIPYHVRPYDLRHLFATLMLSKGGDLEAVASILGHTSTQTTMDHYYHLLKGEKERAVSLIEDKDWDSED